MVRDSKHLMLPLYMAERAWAELSSTSIAGADLCHTIVVVSQGCRRVVPGWEAPSLCAAMLALASSSLLSPEAAARVAFEPLPQRASPRSVRVHNLWDRRVPYADALAWQRRLHQERVLAARAGEACDDVLLVLQHPPVLTLGTTSTLDNVLSDAPPFELVRTERGGEVTYHGPGQLVLYPVLDLRAYRQDAHWYLCALEEVVVRTLADLGLCATREPGLTGVWVDGAKACAIGVKLSRWVSMHGLALNVAPELAHFEHIVPCGIADRPVTSVARELRGRPAVRPAGAHDADASEEEAERLLDKTQQLLLHHFARVFDVTLAAADGEAEAWAEASAHDVSEEHVQ
jgi:lipoyl(octanoyl) transferase